jgi:ABC-type phosphate transport system substrate-binding protein
MQRLKANIMLSHTCKITLASCFTVLLHTSALSQVAVVVHPQSPLSTISQQEATNLFLGKTNQISGAEANLLDLPESHPARALFYEGITGKSLSQVKATWARLTFTGKAFPPQQFPNANAIKKAIAADPKAIGYIDKKDIDDSVKVVLSN